MENQFKFFEFTLGELLFIQSTLGFVRNQVMVETEDPKNPDVIYINAILDKMAKILDYARELTPKTNDLQLTEQQKS